MERRWGKAKEEKEKEWGRRGEERKKKVEIFFVAWLLDSDAALALMYQQIWSVMQLDVWICGWLWLAGGGERVMTHTLTTAPTRDQHSNTEKRHEFFPSVFWNECFQRGKGWVYTVEQLTACVWTDMNTQQDCKTRTLLAFMTYTPDNNARTTPFCFC